MKLEQVFDGGCHCFYDTEIGDSRVLLAIPCQVEDLPDLYHAFLDTGSSWCILPPAVAAELGSEPAPGEPIVRLSTRLGLFEGWLDRARLTFPADVGEAIDVDATWFVSPDWPGPMVIGWKGCIERVRSALDPSEQAFYFARL